MRRVEGLRHPPVSRQIAERVVVEVLGGNRIGMRPGGDPVARVIAVAKGRVEAARRTRDNLSRQVAELVAGVVVQRQGGGVRSATSLEPVLSEIARGIRAAGVAI